MFKDFPRSSAGRPSIPLDDAMASVLSDAEVPWEGAKGGGPIVLGSFGRGSNGVRYRWSIAFSIVLHVSLISLTLWLSQKDVRPRWEPVAVMLRPAPPPRPQNPAPTAKPEELKKGSRGVSLPKAVAQDIQPEAELSFAAQTDPAAMGPTGRWVGGVGSSDARGPGWSNGVESGAIIRRSLARDPQEIDSGWECEFPESEPNGKVVVRIRIHVTDAGRPTHVTIIRPGPLAFNASAIACAMRQLFRPALDTSGRPCEGDRELGILFFRTDSHAFAKEAVTPRPAPPPPLTGPQPDLPVQLDESPSGGDRPSG